MLSHEIANNGRYAWLPGNGAESGEIGKHPQVGIAGVPIGEVQIGYEFFGNVPAKQDVALCVAMLDTGEKNVGGQPFAAINAVVVGSSNLYDVDIVAFDNLLDACQVAHGTHFSPVAKRTPPGYLCTRASIPMTPAARQPQIGNRKLATAK